MKSETKEIDKLLKKVVVGLNTLDHTDSMLAVSADGLAAMHQNDPYLRGALNGVMPPK